MHKIFAGPPQENFIRIKTATNSFGRVPIEDGRPKHLERVF